MELLAATNDQLQCNDTSFVKKGILTNLSNVPLLYPGRHVAVHLHMVGKSENFPCFRLFRVFILWAKTCISMHVVSNLLQRWRHFLIYCQTIVGLHPSSIHTFSSVSILASSCVCSIIRLYQLFRRLDRTCNRLVIG